MRLRYTGALPTVFQTGNVGPVEPGQEFTVPDSLGEAFAARPDIEVILTPPAKAAKSSAKSTTSSAVSAQ